MKKIFMGILFIYSGLLLSSQYLLAQNNQSANFSNSSIDIGIVVKDVDKTAKFYSEAIGLKEVQGFNVSKEIAKRFGLTDGDPLNVRVFVLGDAPNSAKLKIMSFPSKQVKKSSQKFINSTLGFSYLTIFVEDMTDSLNRLKKAEVKLLGETPALLPDGIRYITVFKDPDGNYFELIGPMN